MSKDVLNVGKDDDEFWGTCHEGQCSGPSGNEGASKTNWYRRYVLVFITKESARKALYKNCVSSSVNYLEQQLNMKGASAVEDLAKEVVELCVKWQERFCRNNDTVNTMLKILSRLKDLELTKKILPLLTVPFEFCFFLKKKAFGIRSKEMINSLNVLISVFGWKALEEDLTKLIESSPAKYHKFAIVFLAQCPDSVTKVEFFTSMINNSTDSGRNISNENLASIGLAIFNNIKSCAQFVTPFFNSSKVQNLQVLADVLSSLGKKKAKNAKKDPFYQTACTKLLDQVHKLFQSGKVTELKDIDAVVKSAEFLAVHDKDHFNKLVNEVVHNASPKLLEKLLDCHFAQSSNVAEPVKLLIQARIAQLLPIVGTGEPKYSFCRPKASIPDHPEVQEFLRGPEKTFLYKKFTTKREAQMFKKEYFNGRKSNTTAQVLGCRRDTVVEITKVPPEHEKIVINCCEELRKLQAKLGQSSE